MKKAILMIIAVVIMTGCGKRYPMELNEAEWNNLPPHEKVELRQQQYKIDEERRIVEAERRTERARLKKIEEAKEAKRISNLYSNARVGDIVTINLC